MSTSRSDRAARRGALRALALAFFTLALGGCDATKCVRNTDCGDGLTCRASTCVSLADGGAPDAGPAADGGALDAGP